jgi:transposase
MGKPHPIELRERVVAFVEAGHTHRAAADHFRVSPRFVNNMVILRRETGSLEAKKQGVRAEANCAIIMPGCASAWMKTVI